MSHKIIKSTGLGLVLLLSFTIGCGKKEKQEAQIGSINPSIESDFERVIDKEEVNCEPGRPCPEYIVKIVVKNDDQKKICTGFLTDPKTIATSSSCLTNHLRMDNVSCRGEVFFFFPKSYSKPAERINCNRILKASPLLTNDPLLWRSDLAFLEMEETAQKKRKVLIIEKDGIKDFQSLGLWAVDQLSGHIGVIRKDECEAVHSSYVNPLASEDSSPGVTFVGCPFKNGNTGAPLVDSTGKLRALVSAPVDSKVTDYLLASGLLTKPLKDIFHATNLACSPTIYDMDIKDEVECSKELTETAVDNLRKNMLSPDYQTIIQRLEAALEKTNKFIKFGVRLFPEVNQHIAEIYPKCFKDVSQWIGSYGRSRNNVQFKFVFPYKAYKRIMDSRGKIKTLDITGASTEYHVQFSPKYLMANDEATVFLRSLSEYEPFPEIKTECSLF